MRIIFMGTPEFAVPTLRAILERGHGSLAFTPGRRARRAAAWHLRSPPRSTIPPRCRPYCRRRQQLRRAQKSAALPRYHADAAVVVAYGLILPKAILDAPASAASIFTPRFCRAGAAPRPSTAPSWPATTDDRRHPSCA